MTNSEDVTIQMKDAREMEKFIKKADKLRKISNETNLGVNTIVEIIQVSELKKIGKSLANLEKNISIIEYTNRIKNTK